MSPPDDLQKHILSELVNIREGLVEVRVSLGKYEAFSEAHIVTAEEMKRDLAIHIARTSALEKFQARWSGAYLALTGLATAVGVFFSAVKIAEFFGKT